MSGVKIQKVDHVATEARRPTPRRATMKTYPRSALKGTRSRGGAAIVPVKDPAAPPPDRRKSMRILTKKGADLRRKTIKQKVMDMNTQTVRASLKKSNITINPKTPDHIAREILEGGMEAGMIIVK